ncbi:MAG: tautomerase family protein [Syntrophomonadaceae bacterium]|nr:tautomerase family protein [Syntrophomonadaceae bacterium]MDD3899585.1 tautomerase family protein [Syntrophomonadaceae bacterium]
MLSCSAAEITGIPLSAFTVVIHELPGENIGIGAKTVAEMKAEAHGG